MQSDTHRTVTPALCMLLAVCGISYGTPGQAKPQLMLEILRSSHNGVEIVVLANSSSVYLDRDLYIDIETRAPGGFDVSFPSLAGRTEGFILSGEFDELPATVDGRDVRRRRIRLASQISEEYRIGPLPVSFTDNSRSPAVPGSFETPSLSFTLSLPPAAQAQQDITVVFNPVRIPAPFRGAAATVLIAILLVAMLWLVGLRVRRAALRTRTVAVSPREAALRELDDLLATDLVARRQIKQFYLALTGIVRHHIERLHSIPTVGQTTAEILAAVVRQPCFHSGSAPGLKLHSRLGAASPSKCLTTRLLQPMEGEAVPSRRKRVVSAWNDAGTRGGLADLGWVLQQADLVKFAALEPSAKSIGRVTARARAYIEQS